MVHFKVLLQLFIFLAMILQILIAIRLFRTGTYYLNCSFIIATSLHDHRLNLLYSFLGYFLPLIKIEVPIVVILQKALDATRLVICTLVIKTFILLQIFCDQECEFDRGASKALRLQLVPKLILYAISVFVCVLGDLDLNLNADGLQRVNFANVNLLGHA